MPKNSSAKYYQESKEGLQKKFVMTEKVLLNLYIYFRKKIKKLQEKLKSYAKINKKL